MVFACRDVGQTATAVNLLNAYSSLGKYQGFWTIGDGHLHPNLYLPTMYCHLTLHATLYNLTIATTYFNNTVKYAL